jgi:hypothetical protein
LFSEIEGTAVAWVTPNQLKQVAPESRIVTFETPNQLVYSDITRLTKQLVVSDGQQWVLRSSLPPAPEAAPTAPVEFQLGDTVKSTSTVLNYGIGKIVALTGPGDSGSADYVMVKFDGYSREMPIARRTLQLVGRATVVQSEFPYGIGDFVRVDGQGAPGIIKEVKPESNSAKVTRPNPSNSSVNMTHWIDLGRLQKVPAPQPEPSEATEEPVDPRLAAILGDDPSPVEEVEAEEVFVLQDEGPDYLMLSEAITMLSGFMEDSTDLTIELGEDPYNILEEYGDEDILRQIEQLRWFATLAEQRYQSVKLASEQTTHAED